MESNKEIVCSYLMSYESGNQEKVIEFLHPLHSYYAPGSLEPVNLNDRIAGEAFFFSAFSDIKVNIEVMLSEGDKVASRISMDCLHSGVYQGINGTGRRITIIYISIVQISEEKIIREWAEFAMQGILNQIR